MARMVVPAPGHRLSAAGGHPTPELENELHQDVAEVRRHYQGCWSPRSWVTVALDDDGLPLVTWGAVPGLVGPIWLFPPGVFGLSECLCS